MSSVGKKFLMATTGVGLLLFVIGHMAGNLQIFLGAEAINRYAHFLKSNPEILWPVRIGILVFAAIHIWTSVALTIENRRARDARYEVKELVAASLASRTMIWSGLIIGCFVCYHLAHFTLLLTHPQYRQLDVYSMMVQGFREPAISGFYLLGVGLLCFHLSHGAEAMFQSLGLKNAKYERMIRGFATTVAWVLFIGYASIPAAVLLRIVK
jgi:succinate dehydrogenase / fumarate reductase cytochrome b subunit